MEASITNFCGAVEGGRPGPGLEWACGGLVVGLWWACGGLAVGFGGLLVGFGGLRWASMGFGELQWALMGFCGL